MAGFLAFEIVTASKLNTELARYAPLAVRRTSDQALITTTLTNDAQLFIAGLAASTTYRLDSAIAYEGSTSGDFKIGFTCSGSGSSLFWSQRGIDVVASASSFAEPHGLIALSGSASYGAINAASSPQVANPTGYLFTGTGSNITLQFQWSQSGVDNVFGSTIMTGSTIMLTPLP